MNKEEPYRDQAERLKQRIQKINEKVEVNDHLPPREEIHRQKKKKTKWKLKYPVIRLLVLCFILLPIIIFSAISYRDGVKKINGIEKNDGNTKGYEPINLELLDREDENNSDKTEDSDKQSVETNSAAEQPETDNNSSGIFQSSSSYESIGKGRETDKNSTPTAETIKSKTAQKTNKTIYHTVQPKETLFSLSNKYYHSQRGMEIIRKTNNLTGDQINVGQVLKIPFNN
ncbi:LysM peptidoglycan-binding domain-containing protein [Neobacillus soli]|uniref:LysM peptidoglycan-binding domain-containing protein n=1 Tax=Neobacillus soli TaxID=220688 RepID=UPI000825DF25|nr:LysM domain-containing protein [Neobacillus soli]